MEIFKRKPNMPPYIWKYKCYVMGEMNWVTYYIGKDMHSVRIMGRSYPTENAALYDILYPDDPEYKLIKLAIL